MGAFCKFVTACFLCLCHFSHAEKELKTLILIIATDDKPAYRELQKVWEAYMNSDLNHFEAYFLRADPQLPVPFQIRKNEIVMKTYEGFAPGIINKTIMALEAMQPRLSEFDYVIRTNLSSFYVFPQLLAFLKTLPKTSVYRGVGFYPSPQDVPPEFCQIPFISGAGIILSNDLASLLLKESKTLEKYKSELPDDVFIGLFFQKHNVMPIQAPRCDFPTRQLWLQGKNDLSTAAFHFRAKRHHNFRTAEEGYEDELFILSDLLKMYYPST